MTAPIIVHKALLAGLSTLIPVPFLDSAVKQAVQRNLVKTLAEGYGVALSPRSIAILADDENAPLLRGLASKVMMLPLRWALRRAVIVLSVKGVVDVVSDVYHRAVLLEHAFASGLCAPAGPHSSTDIRAAMDAVCKDVVTAPVERAIRAGLEPYKNALSHAANVLRGRLEREDHIGDDTAERAAAATESASEHSLLAAVRSLGAEIGQVPSEYFDDLRFKLEARLSKAAPDLAVRTVD